MSALRRVLGAPVLWGSLVLFHWAVAAAFARPIAMLVRAALGEHSVGAPGRLLPAVVELLADHPSLGPAIAVAMISATILGGLVWLVAAGGVIARLGGERGVLAGVTASLRHLPGLGVMALYGLVPRVLVLVVGLRIDLFGLGEGVLRVALFLALWSLCAAGEGMARASVVLEGARPYHPRRLLCGYREALRRPKIWAQSAILTLAGAAVVFAALICVTRSLGEGWGLWAARGLTIVGVGLSLWRVAVFVEATRTRRA